ncbi:hypothetical protein [Nonomuraea dietziae]|uniref:hypothetical protein n=1 Tax=Nonomuraea dietziae TaxID=65515 RepID=UPI0031D8FDAC
MTGARPQVGWDAYTVAHAKWFKSNERWGTTPKPGAVVFFSWSGSKSISSINTSVSWRRTTATARSPRSRATPETAPSSSVSVRSRRSSGTATAQYSGA